MDYQASLKSLKKVGHHQNVDIKFVPGKTEDGWLSEDTRNEFKMMFNHDTSFMTNTNSKPSVQEMRDGMGSPQKNIVQNSIKIDSTVIAGMPVRVYRKADLADQTLPSIIYVHGGAFYGGSMMAVDNIARALAAKGSYQVFNLEYPLAPEHPFPAAILACYNALNYLHEHARYFQIDPDKFYMAGDSAGGNLTVVTTYLDHVIFHTNWIKKDILYYPDVDEDMSDRKNFSDKLISEISFKEMKDDISKFINFFNTDTMAINYYCDNENRRNPLISPLLADHLELMPPTELIVGEFDPLRKQGENYINKLRKLHVPVKYIRYNGMSHAFLDNIGYYPQAEDAIEEGIKFLNNKE